MSETFVVCAAGIDLPWARWIAFQLQEANANALIDASPGHSLNDFAGAIARSDRTLVVLSPGAVADDVARARWAAVEPARLVGVVVQPCDLRDFPTTAPLIELHGLGQDARERLLGSLGVTTPAVTAPAYPGEQASSLARVDALINAVPRPAEHRQVVSSSGPLSRLRILSERATSELGWLPGGMRFDAELYVRRDIEPVVVESARSGKHPPQVIHGEPGAGKSSLLWGVARRLLEYDDRDVYLLKATWLRETQLDRTPIVGRGVLAEAVGTAAARGRACTILIDTVDLLLNNDVSSAELIAVVDEARTAGATVVVTSRPREAKWLPGEWNRLELRDYGTSADPDSMSEFERAVAAHVRAYCPNADTGHKIAAQLVTAVARRKLLGVLCRQPLTLRMLFELYAPTSIPEKVDVTGLHQQFWRDRVFQDRRAWHDWTPAANADVDLRDTAAAIALRMLVAGAPEISVDADVSYDPVVSGKFRAEIDLLVVRGVGELVSGADGTMFRFFHQTFFEFAAAQALLHTWGAEGLSLLERRCRDRPNDFFLLAVFEQTWLCAWPDAALADVTTASALRFLDEARRKVPTLAPSLRSTALKAIVQSADVPPECLKELSGVLRMLDPAEVRECLDLMPPPVRGWRDEDVEVLRQCLDRRDWVWVSVVKVVERLSHHDRELALRAIGQLDLANYVASLPRKDFADHPELLKPLFQLLQVSPEEVMGHLGVLCRAAVKHDLVDSYIPRLFELLDTHADAVPHVDLGKWADDMLPDHLKRIYTTIKAHARLHHVQTARLAQTAGGWSRQLVELKTLVGRMESDSELAWLDIVRLGGMLTAFAWEAPPRTAAAVVAVLRQIASGRVHGELRRGWLAEYGQRLDDNAVTEAWVDWLVTGLPVGRHQEDTAEKRWAGTALRMLEAPFLRATTVARLAERTAARIEPCPTARDVPAHLEPWIEPDALLRVVVRSMRGGSGDAREAVHWIADNPSVIGTARRLFTDQLVPTHGTDRDNMLLLDIAVQWGERRVVENFLRHPALPLAAVRTRTTRIRELIESGIGSVRAKDQSATGELLQVAIESDVLPLPAWAELTDWLGRAHAVNLRKTLIELVTPGLDEGRYDPNLARATLESIKSKRPAADVYAARTALVPLLAKWFCDPEALLEVAFRDPVDASFLPPASSYVQPAHRRNRPVTGADAVHFLLDFGKRLAKVPFRTRKDTAARWQAAISEVITGASSALQLEVLAAFPQLDDEFKSKLVLQLEPHRHPEVQRALQDLVQDTALGDRLRRNALLVLADKASQRDWPELMDLLNTRDLRRS